MPPRQLSTGTLDLLPDAVGRPRYDRSRVRAGIVHLGVGAFHRTHQAVYVDRLLEQGRAGDWGICGVGIRPQDRRMRDVLAAQDCLYTVLVRHPDGTEQARVVGSLVDYLFAPDDPAAVVARLADPVTRIVSLTVTEGGYCLDPATGRFDRDHPDIRHDLTGSGTPRTPFAYLAAALARRRDAGAAPFTVVSCDNIPGNGRVAAEAVRGFAAALDPGLAEWIGERGGFPNSMVDRITPATPAGEAAAYAERYGVRDEWPVICEPFTQWVLEDGFVAGRPPLQDAGVQLVGSAAPYELLKLRLLNGGHQALGYLGVLAGHRFVHEAADDPLFAAFFERFAAEAGPTVPPLPDVTPAGYAARLLERFANPAVADTLARLCVDGSDRIPKFLLPAVRDNLAAGRGVDAAATVVAGWARYCAGTDERGEPIGLVDGRAATLRAAARAGSPEGLAFVTDRQLFGELAAERRFVEAYGRALERLRTGGVRAALRAVTAAGTPDVTAPTTPEPDR